MNVQHRTLNIQHVICLGLILEVRCSSCLGSEQSLGFSAASDIRSCQFDRKRDRGLAESQTRISNIEQGMSNIEGRNSIEFYGFKRQSAAISPFVILRFEILLFCGSLFGHAEFHTRVQRLWVYIKPACHPSGRSEPLIRKL